MSNTKLCYSAYYQKTGQSHQGQGHYQERKPEIKIVKVYFKGEVQKSGPQDQGHCQKVGQRSRSPRPWTNKVKFKGQGHRLVTKIKVSLPITCRVGWTRGCFHYTKFQDQIMFKARLSLYSSALHTLNVMSKLKGLLLNLGFIISVG